MIGDREREREIETETERKREREGDREGEIHTSRECAMQLQQLIMRIMSVAVSGL